jgi:hypothetical protein
MKNISLLIKSLFIAFSLLIVGCEKTTYEFGDILTPSNISVTTEIVGSDENNPYGDGSGEVKFTTTSDNAITYKYIHNGSETMSPTGVLNYSFGSTGVHKYIVTVVASGKAGVSSSKSVEVEVLVVYSPPADLITMLTGDSSRNWRIKAEETGHFGVGPADESSSIWWSAAPYDKDGKGAYDDILTFNVDGTFTHTTNNTAYGQAGPMTAELGGDQGQTPNDDGEFENFPLDNYSENWGLSAPGGQETLSFTGIGYHGFYVGGDHKYVILTRSDDEMYLRTTGADGNGWFVILVAVD